MWNAFLWSFCVSCWLIDINDLIQHDWINPCSVCSVLISFNMSTSKAVSDETLSSINCLEQSEYTVQFFGNFVTI